MGSSSDSSCARYPRQVLSEGLRFERLPLWVTGVDREAGAEEVVPGVVGQDVAAVLHQVVGREGCAKRTKWRERERRRPRSSRAEGSTIFDDSSLRLDQGYARGSLNSAFSAYSLTICESRACESRSARFGEELSCLASELLARLACNSLLLSVSLLPVIL